MQWYEHLMGIAAMIWCAVIFWTALVAACGYAGKEKNN
jgi:hypothetical protein